MDRWTDRGRTLRREKRTRFLPGAVALTHDLEIAPGAASGQFFAMDDPTPYFRQNVLGSELKPCNFDPVTGFYRDGSCRTGAHDGGVHVVCAEMTEEFLEFSKARGNDLSTPRLEYEFPGLKPGDRWCLCVTRWVEAYEAGMAPKVVLESTQATALEFVELGQMQAHAADG